MTLRDDLLRAAAVFEAVLEVVDCHLAPDSRHALSLVLRPLPGFAREAAEKLPAESDATAALHEVRDAQIAKLTRERDEAIASCVRAFGEIAAWRELACSWVADASRADGEVSRDALEKRLRELSVTESRCRKLQAIVIGSLAEASRVFE